MWALRKLVAHCPKGAVVEENRGRGGVDRLDKVIVVAVPDVPTPVGAGGARVAFASLEGSDMPDGVTAETRK